jgi:hypothetical protein
MHASGLHERGEAAGVIGFVGHGRSCRCVQLVRARLPATCVAPGRSRRARLCQWFGRVKPRAHACDHARDAVGRADCPRSRADGAKAVVRPACGRARPIRRRAPVARAVAGACRSCARSLSGSIPRGAEHDALPTPI